MPRSDEAIRRRALKRQRTEGEQRQVDRKDMAQLKRRKQQQDTPSNNDAEAANQQGSTVIDPMKEDGAWTCRSCGNGNFASRNWCNSKTCHERRPPHLAPFTTFKKPTGGYQEKARGYHHSMDARDEEGAWTCPSCQYRNFASRDVCKGLSCQEQRPDHAISFSSKNSRHDPATSKQLVWSKQADSATMSKNQELRKQYHETGGKGLSEEDVERAKILISRDERKRQKKEKKKQDESNKSLLSSMPKQAVGDSAANEQADKSTEPSNSKIQQLQNKRLRKRFLASGRTDMTNEEVERAKALIARKERKQKKRAVLVTEDQKEKNGTIQSKEIPTVASQ